MPTQPESAATELLQEVWVGELGFPPLPVESDTIAERLGLKYFVADLQPNISGMLLRRPGCDPEIHVNRADSPVRRRFSGAHELGHYVKRTSENSGSSEESWQFVDFRSPLSAAGTDAEEIWANQFAADLLMPRELVRKLRSEVVGVAALAYAFGVSAEAMRFRLSRLGLS